MTRSQAERAKRQFMEKINSQREAAGDSVTLDRFFREHYWNEDSKTYGDELKTKRPSTQRDMKNAMVQILVPRFGAKRIDSIRTGEIQAFLIGLIGSQEEGKISRRTALKYKTYLSSMFSAAVRLESGVTRNPVRAVRLTVEEPAKPVFVHDDLQTQQIADCLEDPRHKMMWNMNLWMGNRIGETRALRWKCVDWETGRVIVTESLFEGKSNKPKTKAGERVVVLNEAQLAELKEYKQKNHPDAGPEGWLFPGKRNRPLDAGSFMTEVIKPIAERLGFPEIHWHALRHWNNSAMLNSGIDPIVRMQRVGHSSVKTNLIYSHADLALQKAASDAIWQRLQAAKQELEKQKAGAQQAPLSPLSVTLTVTPNRGVPVSP
jgi:integrase